jgi:SET domain-containing protein
MLFRKNSLYLRSLPGKGRGLFCTEDIQAGEMLEVAPLLVLGEIDSARIASTLLHDYVFSSKDLSQDMRARHGISNPARARCLALGIASLCNHSRDPNAATETGEAEGCAYFALKALRDIPRETEICITYGSLWALLRGARRLE